MSDRRSAPADKGYDFRLCLYEHTSCTEPLSRDLLGSCVVAVRWVTLLPRFAVGLFERPHRVITPLTRVSHLRWTYQGSNAQSRVDYWQKDGVKLDYYPTTGTAKTSMDHPSQGKTQMFRRDLVHPKQCAFRGLVLCCGSCVGVLALAQLQKQKLQGRCLGCRVVSTPCSPCTL